MTADTKAVRLRSKSVSACREPLKVCQRNPCYSQPAAQTSWFFVNRTKFMGAGCDEVDSRTWLFLTITPLDRCALIQNRKNYAFSFGDKPVAERELLSWLRQRNAHSDHD